MPEPEASVRQLLEQQWPEAARFFERAESDVAQPSSVAFKGLYASVPRRLGQLAQRKLGALSSAAPAAKPHWTLTDCARLWLVLSALRAVAPAEQAPWLLQLFEGGEIGEQVSILRTLSTLPEAARFVETGVQACRHNSLDVFEAIVAENAYLSEYFPELNFNQAVMKAIFNGVSVRRIEGLEPRITAELSRMAAGYASERRAAGRPVPDDAEYLAHYGAN
jgi:hypothetical protein